MSKTEQVRVDLVANDKASAKIDDVADAVDDLEHKQVEIPITADDQASKVIGDVDADADKLTAGDREIVLRARVDAAKAELKSLRDDLDQTGDKAESTARQLDRVDGPGGGGGGLRGQAIADLTGPLGDASSAASDFAGVFDGLGDISEEVAGRIGVSAATMSTAIGGIGVAVAAGAAAWTYFKQRQEAAREAQRKLVEGQRDFNRALREGNYSDAADKLVETYSDVYEIARKVGVSGADVTQMITGQADAIPGLTAKIDDLEAAYTTAFTSNGKNLGAIREQLDAYVALRDKVEAARGSYTEANGTLAEQDRQLGQVETALRRTGTSTDTLGRKVGGLGDDVDDLGAAFDRLRGDLDIEQAALDFERAMTDALDTAGETAADTAGDVLALKRAVVDAAEATGKSPIQVQTELDAIDAGDLNKVKADVEAWYRQYPITLASKLDRPGQGGGTSSGGGTSPTRMLDPGGGATTVNVNMPAGSRGVDVVRQVAGQTRRSGRRYGARVVHYARR